MMKPKADSTTRRADTGPDEPPIKYPVLNETQLCSRWNLSPKTLQRWRSEGIGPPAWHIGRSVRYLLMEVEAFERKAQVTWRSSAGRALSESSPTAREDAIEQMMQQRPGRRDQIFYSAKEVADITGLPAHWLHQNQERQRLGIPFYRMANGDVIRFSIEEVFRWEVHHLRPCRSGAGMPVDALQSASS
ncbi:MULTISPECIES: helix-turn-helix transcriptional regulator [Burkholderiaceae]|nr:MULTISPECIES: helix-turn-helix domain-containing protein [Burkholderiaceae]MCT9072804.1 helix-turn-helix domain-containing protein [Cupriavidus gilardii]